jgi:hypothetical protein
MAARAAPIRLKTHWFRQGVEKTPEQQAGAMGFTLWRVARRTLERMRGADFDIDTGEPYFAFLREVLVFLLAVTDRLAHQRLDAAARQAFTTALVLHVAGTLAENELELLGEPAPGQPDPHGRFIGLFNEVASYYAEFDGETGRSEFTPDFAFVRYLGHRLESTLPEKDRLWVIEQVMAVEAPEAVGLIQRAMSELHSTAPRRMRASALGAD